MSPSEGFWSGRNVLVTGHTGFKGGWLSLWLQQLGAQVSGMSLPPPTTPSLFEIARVSDGMDSALGDIRDAALVRDLVAQAQPQIVLHLAAQPLVRQSYRDPLETYATNVLGTAHVLEAVRSCPSVRAVLVVTTDKCYENHEQPVPYREDDALGGYDPYSSSKACAELVASAYRRSFLADAGVALATARAGNVIGGGDWSPDRLLPDLLRAFAAGELLHLRYPQAVRPWQHVLEPLAGYLLLAERLITEPTLAAQAWNFGPRDADARSVGKVVELASRLWQNGDAALETPRWTTDAAPQPHEAGLLTLDSTKAHSQLGWQPRWSVEEAIAHTLAWHHSWLADADMRQLTLNQIAHFTTSLTPA